MQEFEAKRRGKKRGMLTTGELYKSVRKVYERNHMKKGDEWKGDSAREV